MAFVLIKTEGMDQVSPVRITREVQAMGRLGSHPHIVTVFDFGEQESQPEPAGPVIKCSRVFGGSKASAHGGTGNYRRQDGWAQPCSTM